MNAGYRYGTSLLRSWQGRLRPTHQTEAARLALPCLLMIPGTMCDERLFKRQAIALRGTARLVVADYSLLRDRSAWLERLLARLPTRFSLAGFSLGGMFAIELLRMAPERVDRMALIASNAQPAGRKHQRRSRQLRRLWQGQGPERLIGILQTSYFHHEAARRLHAPLVRRMGVQTSFHAAVEQFAWAASRPSGLAMVRDFSGPMLIASGALDRVCPPKLQRAMHDAHPRARWLEIPRCGHFVPLEAAVPLNRALVRWMQEPLTS